MKLKRIISVSLVIGLFFNTTLTSLGSVLSQDDRYETFEGNNIAIKDVLEENKVDIEIEGDSLVNVLGTQGTATVNLINSGDRVRDFNDINLKSNTTYTACVNITNLSSSETSKLKLYYKAINESGEIVSVYPDVHFTNENVREGLMTITFETDNRKSEGTFYFYVDEMGGNSGGTTNEFSFDMNKCMLLEGDWSNKELPEYFEGIKSVGEDTGNIKVKSQNKNLFNINNFTKMDYTFGLPIINEKDKNFIIDNNITYTAPASRWNVGVGGIYKVKKNTNYTAKYEEAISDKVYDMAINIVGLYEDDLSIDYWNASNRNKYIPRVLRINHSLEETNASLTYNSGNYDYLAIYIGGAWIESATETRTITLKNVAIYEGEDENVSYEKHNSFEREVLLNEPLRGLPNGIKDRIIKRNGQWVIERNCIEVTYNGDENWSPNSYTSNRNNTTARYLQLHSAKDNTYLLSDNFYQFISIWDDTEGIQYDGWGIYISIDKSKLNSDSTEAFKEWLSKNPTTIVYERDIPIYEPLNIDSTVNLYLDTTYISNNSTIPANMKIIVDRTANRAKEAIELAECYPTTENISKARYWTNLMRESILKDSYQSKINNNNAHMEDLSMEKKYISTNSDIYIRPKNMLSLSVETNSIVFDDVDSTESVEKLNAINLSVISSLPYKVNAYLEDEIYNSDKTVILDKSTLNIRASNTNEYKIFTNLSTAITLLDDQEAGVNNIHGIDLKLLFDRIPRVDTYKATIKLEVEQK